jgi:DNA-binding transcriptional ArsR family regulator
MDERNIPQQPVFAALADPVRRSLLLNLAENSPRSATQFARQYPISRQGILKHLGILYEAGLVKTSKKGRDVLYELKLEPLSDIDEFTRKIGAIWDERLMRLKTMLESENL